MKNRLAVYNKQTAPILPRYEAQGLLGRVDGMQPVAKVAESIDAVLAAAAKEESPGNRPTEG